MDRPILVEKLLKCARREANVRRGKDRADDRDHLRASLDQWLRVLERDSPNGHYRDMERSPCTGDKFDLRTRRSRFDGRRKKAAECYIVGAGSLRLACQSKAIVARRADNASAAQYAACVRDRVIVPP